MQPPRREHAAHADQEQRNSESQGNPETQAHAAQFVVILLSYRHCNTRFKSHAANRAYSWLVGDSLRMHWADVLGFRSTEQLQLESHSAFGTRTRLRRRYFRIHRTEIFR